MSETNIILPEEVIMSKILLIRGEKVMLDIDLAKMYGVETKRLKEQVRRNIERFPSDFMFELNDQEIQNLRSQNATSSWGGSRYKSLVFTEHGILMLSSVLRSASAIQININIMRAFIKIREMLLTNKDIILKLEQVDKQLLNNGDGILDNSTQIAMLWEILSKIQETKSQNKKRNKIGY